MSKEDEILAQLQKIMEEIQAGKKEEATTLSLPMDSKKLRTSQSKFSKRTRRIMVVFLLIVFLNIAVGLIVYKQLANSEPTIEQGTILQQVQELSTLATSEAYVKAVIEKEDNQLFGKEIQANIPGTKRKILLVIPGTVMAGINLEEIDRDAIKMNEEEKVVELTLPRAKIIQEPSLNFEQVQTFSVEGIFRSEVNWEEAYELATEAKEMVKEEAIRQGLLEIAEKNGEKTFQQFFSTFGYDVIINYVD